MKKKLKGFTLIELLVVVSILGILILLVVNNFISSTNTSKIKAFESNFRTLIVYAEVSYINNNNDDSKVYDDVNPEAINLNNKPAYAKYEVDEKTKEIKATLKKEAFDGSEDYVITYDMKTSTITQYPNPIPKGATPLSAKNN